MNGLHYKYMFYYYLNKCNYKIVNTDTKYKFIETDDKTYKEIDDNPYDGTSTDAEKAPRSMSSKSSAFRSTSAFNQ